jgi:hypothetical protein
MSAPGLKASALAYALRGLHVIPLHSAHPSSGCSCRQRKRCEQAGKHPRVQRWQTRGTSDAATVRQWWELWPDANVGLLTGADHGIFALDIDPRHGGDASLADLERRHGRLPRTVQHRTGGGGRHLIFAHPAIRRVRNSTGKLGTGLDVRGHGGQIVAPPSRNAQGAYVVDPASSEEFAQAPAWLLDLVCDDRAPRRSTGTRKGKRTTVPARIPEGCRNDELTSLGGRMRLVASPPEAIRGALHATNAARCDPPLPKAEVDDIANSATKWHSLPWHTDPRKFFNDPRLKPTDRHVLRVLCDYADADGACRPTVATLMTQTGYDSEATITNATGRLEAARRIEVTRNHRKPNRYRILRSVPSALALQEQQQLVVGPQQVGSNGSAEVAL